MSNALVTGGSRGIGCAIAKELSKANWRLFLVAEHEESLRDAAGEIESPVSSLAIDLGMGEAAARSVARAAEAELGSIDLLVLNAGIFIEENLAELDSSTFKRNMAVNLEANVLLVRYLLPLMVGAQKPRIVIIGSTAAYEAYPLVPTYGIAKWALRGFAINLRDQLRSERIGVTFLSPGGTLTDMWEGEDLPPNRLLEPKDVALLVLAITELSEQAVVDEIVMRPMLGDIHD